MSKTTTFNALFERARKQLAYYVQGPILQFTEAVVERMEALKISNSELANKLKCKPSYVTKVLRGGPNFTLKSMVKIALALEAEVSVALVPKLASETWGDVMQNLQDQRRKISQKRSVIWPSTRGTMIQLNQFVPVQSANKSQINEQFSLAA